MTPHEALKHIRILTNAALGSDDPRTLRRLLEEINKVVKMAAPDGAKVRLQPSA
jgi:hypothetical protein